MIFWGLMRQHEAHNRNLGWLEPKYHVSTFIVA